jgi:hypothetical protein
MRVWVRGLSRLSTVRAACFRSAEHAINGCDDNSSIASALERCEPPLGKQIAWEVELAEFFDDINVDRAHLQGVGI